MKKAIFKHALREEETNMEREELKAKLKEYMEIPRLSGYEEKMARRKGKKE